MSVSGQNDKFHIGFLTAIDIPERGYLAGLLVTNRFGRPLEFQCTTPVRPNRTQEILYGPTLVPFVLGELIGRTLVEKVTVKPHLVVTDDAAVLELRNHVAVPIVCLASEQPPSFRVGRQHVRVHPDYPSDRETVASFAASLPDEANLTEPLERVREALNETVKQGAAAA